MTKENVKRALILPTLVTENGKEYIFKAISPVRPGIKKRGDDKEPGSVIDGDVDTDKIGQRTIFLGFIAANALSQYGEGIIGKRFSLKKLDKIKGRAANPYEVYELN
jgi:hypothetical protein